MFGTKVLEEKESKINGKLTVSRSLGFGTYIQAGGLTQSGGIVGVIWKPVLKRIQKRINPVKCLILGVGGGTVAKYLRLYWKNVEIIGVDIDPAMVDLGKKYLGLDVIGIDLKISDAYEYLMKENSKFDLIIVDLYQGDEFPKKFEKEEFLKHLNKIKIEGGIVIFNRLFYGAKKVEALGFEKKLSKTFTKVEKFKPPANLMFICS